MFRWGGREGVGEREERDSRDVAHAEHRKQCGERPVFFPDVCLMLRLDIYRTLGTVVGDRVGKPAGGRRVHSLSTRSFILWAQGTPSYLHSGGL